MNNSYSSRLDRFLVSEEWKGHFSGLSQKLLPRPPSDHAPILLDEGGIRSGKSPLRFKNMWLRVEGFKDLVRRWWTGYTFSGSFSHILAYKLMVLKQDLKTLNTEVIGNVFSNKEAAFFQIGYWDAKESDLRLSLEDAEARRTTVDDFSKWTSIEEISWR